MILSLTAALKAVHGRAAGGEIDQLLRVDQFGRRLLDVPCLSVRELLFDGCLKVTEVELALLAALGKLKDCLFIIAHWLTPLPFPSPPFAKGGLGGFDAFVLTL